MLGGAFLVLAAHGSAPARGPQQAGGAADRAALLAQCADCHPAESAAWATTGMARALEPLRPGELAGLAPVTEEPSHFTYAFEGDGPGARIAETHAGRPGEAPFRDSLPLAFAIGAGELDRSFAALRGRRLWLAPLEVVGHGDERHAALAPGHAMQPGTRFTLALTPECLGCHTDAPPPRDWPLNLQAKGWVPRGISCGACHGALAGHVAARSAELSGTGTVPDDPLARERTWPRVARMERCAACHLQGDARVELVPDRLGPPPPGTPLLATRAVFVARQPTDEIGFVSHVQRLVLSPCYLESEGDADGGLSCETCHDPHRSLHVPDERARVRAACHACHEPDQGEPRATDCALPRAERGDARDCVDCHMRATGVFDVAEVAIHDHWIRRRPPAPSRTGPLRFPESPSGDWKVFAWPDAAAPVFDGDDPGPWTMALAHGEHFERARARMEQGLGDRAAGLAMLHHVRGSLQERAGDLAAARRSYEAALALDPSLAEAATNLGPLLGRLGALEEGRRLLDALITRHPLADGAIRNRAVLRFGAGDLDGARTDLETAWRLLPDAAVAQALARLAEGRGDAAAAARWTEEARRIEPRLP